MKERMRMERYIAVALPVYDLFRKSAEGPFIELAHEFSEKFVNVGFKKECDVYYKNIVNVRECYENQSITVCFLHFRNDLFLLWFFPCCHHMHNKGSWCVAQWGISRLANPFKTLWL